MKLPHRTPEDSISLPPGVDFRGPCPKYKTDEQMVSEWLIPMLGYWLRVHQR